MIEVSYSGQNAANITALTERSGLTDEKVLIARALAILEILISHRERGDKIVFERADGTRSQLDPTDVIGPEK